MGDAADDMFDAAMREQEGDDEGVIIPGQLVHQTKDAVLWRRTNVAEEDSWIPKSQILSQEDDSITITTWLADKKNWWDDVDGPSDREIPF